MRKRMIWRFTVAIGNTTYTGTCAIWARNARKSNPTATVSRERVLLVGALPMCWERECNTCPKPSFMSA